VRRPGAGQRVAVVPEPGAEEVRVVAETEAAVPARDVRRRHDAVTDRERPAVLVARWLARPDGGDRPDVLVPADERVRGVALVLRAGVLNRLAPPVCLSVPQIPE
jgi:hypothetical protein